MCSVSTGVFIRASASVYRPWTLVPADVAVGLREHAPVLLERRDQVWRELDRHDDLRAHRRPHDVIMLGVLDFLVGERHHLTERECEVEWRMRNRTEVRVRPWRRCVIVGRNDGEVDLLGLFRHAPKFNSPWCKGCQWTSVSVFPDDAHHDALDLDLIGLD